MVLIRLLSRQEKCVGMVMVGSKPEDDRRRGKEKGFFSCQTPPKTTMKMDIIVWLLLPTHCVITSTVHIARRQAIESFETEMTDAMSRMDGDIRFIDTIDILYGYDGRKEINIADARLK